MIRKSSSFLGEHAVRAALNCLATGLFPTQPVAASPDYVLLPRPACAFPDTAPSGGWATQSAGLPQGLGRYENHLLSQMTGLPVSLFRFEGPAGSGKTSTLLHLAQVLSQNPFPGCGMIVVDARPLALEAGAAGSGETPLEAACRKLAACILGELARETAGKKVRSPFSSLPLEAWNRLAPYPSLADVLSIGAGKAAAPEEGVPALRREPPESGRKALLFALGWYLAETMAVAPGHGQAILVLDSLDILPPDLAGGLIRELCGIVPQSSDGPLRLVFSSRPGGIPEEIMPETGVHLLRHQAPEAHREMIFRVDRFLQDPHRAFYFSHLDDASQGLFLKSLSCLRASLARPGSFFHALLLSVGAPNLAACHLLAIRFCLSLCFSGEPLPRVAPPRHPADLPDRNDLLQEWESLLAQWEAHLAQRPDSPEEAACVGEWLSAAVCRMLEWKGSVGRPEGAMTSGAGASWALRPGARHFLHVLARERANGRLEKWVKPRARDLTRGIRFLRGEVGPDLLDHLIQGFEKDLRTRLIHFWLAAGSGEERNLVQTLGSFALAVCRELSGRRSQEARQDSIRETAEPCPMEPGPWNDFSDAALAASGLGRGTSESFNAFYWGGSDLSLAGFHTLFLAHEAGRQGLGWEELRSRLQSLGISRVKAGCILLSLIQRSDPLLAHVSGTQDQGLGTLALTVAGRGFWEKMLPSLDYLAWALESVPSVRREVRQQAGAWSGAVPGWEPGVWILAGFRAILAQEDDILGFSHGDAKRPAALHGKRPAAMLFGQVHGQGLSRMEQLLRDLGDNGRALALKNQIMQWQSFRKSLGGVLPQTRDERKRIPDGPHAG